MTASSAEQAANFKLDAFHNAVDERSKDLGQGFPTIRLTDWQTCWLDD